MMLKQGTDNTKTTISAAAIACGNCGVEERRLLHHVRHRGSFRRLCTSCVLRLHPHSFCPTCFLVYDQSPPPSTDAVTCFKCYSSSHSHCVGDATSPYVCPPCKNPNLPIFVAKKVSKEETDGRSYREIDNRSAGILFAAARIAAGSMSKAAVGARAEAERRAKEASFTRKRAREALEHLSSLVTREKLKKNDCISGMVNVTLKDKSSTPINKADQNPVLNRLGVDSSTEVLVALNNVELKETEKAKGLRANINPQNVISVESNNTSVANLVVEDPSEKNMLDDDHVREEEKIYAAE